MRPRRLAAVVATVAVVQACAGEAAIDESRSEGHPVASLELNEQVGVYRAAINTAFDVGPGLVLLLHQTHLPQGAGFDGGSPQSDALYDALQEARLLQGRCSPSRPSNQLRAPVCDMPESGYVLRASEIFQRSTDTLQFYLHSEVYATRAGPGMDAFAFEMAYRLVRTGVGRFRVVQEGRVRQIGRKSG
jgi:hypothetical protein